jgi:hypothetical protein
MTEKKEKFPDPKDIEKEMKKKRKKNLLRKKRSTFP